MVNLVISYFKDKSLLPGGVYHVLVIEGKSHELANPITNSHLLEYFLLLKMGSFLTARKEDTGLCSSTESSGFIGTR